MTSSPEDYLPDPHHSRGRLGDGVREYMDQEDQVAEAAAEAFEARVLDIPDWDRFRRHVRCWVPMPMFPYQELAGLQVRSHRGAHEHVDVSYFEIREVGGRRSAKDDLDELDSQIDC